MPIIIVEKMQLALILIGALLADAGVIQEKNCTGVTIDNIYYDLEELKSDLDRPYQLAVDYSTNTLFFSYSLNEDDDVFKTAYINLNSKHFADLTGVNNGFSQSVDQKNHEVYIGGSDGLYKYNHKTKAAEFFGAKNIDIWSVFFKDLLYYSVHPSQFLYTFNVNGDTVRFKDLEDTKVDQFIIDNENIMFFTNATGLYSQKKGTKDAILYKEFPSYGVRGFNTDINGNVYVCFQDGIYKIDKVNQSLEKVVNVDDAFGLAFDNENNIIYSDATKLIRLVPNKEKTC